MSPEEKSAWKPKDAAVVTDPAGGGGGDSASKAPMEVEAWNWFILPQGHTENSKIRRFEQTKLPTKLLDYVLWINKSNINRIMDALRIYLLLTSSCTCAFIYLLVTSSCTYALLRSFVEPLNAKGPERKTCAYPLFFFKEKCKVRDSFLGPTWVIGCATSAYY